MLPILTMVQFSANDVDDVDLAGTPSFNVVLSRLMRVLAFRSRHWNKIIYIKHKLSSYIIRPRAFYGDNNTYILVYYTINVRHYHRIADNRRYYRTNLFYHFIRTRPVTRIIRCSRPKGKEQSANSPHPLGSFNYGFIELCLDFSPIIYCVCAVFLNLFCQIFVLVSIPFSIQNCV